MEKDTTERIPVYLTKEQWEEVYQWYLIVKDDYRMEDFAVEAGEKIAKTLIDKYGSFR